LAASAAISFYLQTVGVRVEAVLRAHLLLQALDGRIAEFEHLSTFYTDEMIVMFVITDVLIVRLVLSEENFADQPTLYKKR